MPLHCNARSSRSAPSVICIPRNGSDIVRFVNQLMHSALIAPMLQEAICQGGIWLLVVGCLFFPLLELEAHFHWKEFETPHPVDFSGLGHIPNYPTQKDPTKLLGGV